MDIRKVASSCGGRGQGGEVRIVLITAKAKPPKHLPIVADLLCFAAAPRSEIHRSASEFLAVINQRSYLVQYSVSKEGGRAALKEFDVLRPIVKPTCSSPSSYS